MSNKNSGEHKKNNELSENSADASGAEITSAQELLKMDEAQVRRSKRRFSIAWRVAVYSFLLSVFLLILVGDDAPVAVRLAINFGPILWFILLIWVIVCLVKLYQASRTLNFNQILQSLNKISQQLKDLSNKE